MTAAGAVAVAAALIILWTTRIISGTPMYVSELGAAGTATQHWFEAALLLIVTGGSLIATAGRHLRSRARLLSAWSPSMSLWISCGFFLVASQVSCTSGCPLPVGAGFTWQDFIHTSAAVLAFTAACWAILQSSFGVDHRVLQRFSLGTAAGVAATAGAGALMSVLQLNPGLGGTFEFVATTLGLGWILVLGIVMWRSHPAGDLSR